MPLPEIYQVIPIGENNFTFERVKAPGLDDRKLSSIKPTIQLTIVESRGFHALSGETHSELLVGIA